MDPFSFYVGTVVGILFGVFITGLCLAVKDHREEEVKTAIQWTIHEVDGEPYLFWKTRKDAQDPDVIPIKKVRR